MAKKLTTREWLQRAIESGRETVKSLAGKLGRSASTIRDIISGRRPGENLRESARDLAKGKRKVTPPPPVKTPKKKAEDAEAERKKAEEAERKRQEELARREREAKARELAAAAAQGITVTVTGKMGTSKDFRNRSVSADLEPEDAVEFLMLRDQDEQAALDFFFEVGYGAPLSVERLDSLVIN
jgi:hypothetical protein